MASKHNIGEPQAVTISVFCRQHAISRQSYYALREQGLGPEEMQVGRSVRISAEAAKRWRIARENDRLQRKARQ